MYDASISGACIFWLLTSFNNYHSDCHISFIAFVHLCETVDMMLGYFTNEHVANVNSILLF